MVGLHHKIGWQPKGSATGSTRRLTNARSQSKQLRSDVATCACAARQGAARASHLTSGARE